MPPEPPRIAVDRIEGDIAVLDIGGDKTVDVPASLLPEGAVEGSVLTLTLALAADAAKDAAEARLERLRSRSPKPSGSLDL